MTGAAWREFCQRLAAMGDHLLDPNLPSAPRDRAEGYRHLMNQVACWMTYALGSSDSLNPLLFRHNDLVYRWGGPNVDQNARRTMISGAHKYRLSGTMGSCEEFAVQVKRGEMHSGNAGVDDTLWASELGIQQGDHFVITISADPDDHPTLLMSAGSCLLHVRDYYYQWRPAEPAVFVIERTDRTEEPPARLSPTRVAEMLDLATRQIENSMSYWPRYQEDLRRATPLNQFSPPGLVAEGVGDMYYAHAFVRLAADDALVVTVDPEEAAHWNVQLYSRAWYEPLDQANRVTHLNEKLAVREPDGSVQVVVSGSDPMVPNWLDTEGREEVMATSRWTRPAQAPSITASVVSLSDLYSIVQAPRLNGAERQHQIEQRRAHVAWRYHT